MKIKTKENFSFSQLKREIEKNGGHSITVSQYVYNLAERQDMIVNAIKNDGFTVRPIDRKTIRSKEGQAEIMVKYSLSDDIFYREEYHDMRSLEAGWRRSKESAIKSLERYLVDLCKDDFDGDFFSAINDVTFDGVEGTKTADEVRKQITDLENECFCDL